MRCLKFLFAGCANALLLLPVIMAFGFLHVPAKAQAQPVVAELAASSREWEKILPVAKNLKIDGDAAVAAKKPILLFFNLSACHYCRGALREVIVPMFRNADWRAALEFRQITIDDGKSLIDFDGKSVENIAFAQKRKGTFAPTVMVVDGTGQLLGEPLVGIANFDFYGAYVDSLVNKAIADVKAIK
jgi:thioredoxin-related protein